MSYWDTQGHTPPVPVISRTPGDTKPKPSEHIPGTVADPDGLGAKQGAEDLWPTYDAVTHTAPAAKRPEGFTSLPANLDPNAFLAWHTAYQLEYVQTKGTGTPPVVTIGPANGTNITVMLSVSKKEIFVLDFLSKRDLSVMPDADQAALASLPQFAAIADRLGLIPTGSAADVQTVRSQMSALVVNAITGLGTYRIPGYDPQSPLIAADQKVFVDELNLLKAQIENMVMFDSTAIQEQLEAIKKRFERAYAFKNAPIEGTTSYAGATNPYPTNVISLDGGESVGASFNTFMKQERRILSIKQEAMDLANTGSVRVDGSNPTLRRNLSAPELLAMFMLHSYLTEEAGLLADTQELSELNALLKTFGFMSKCLNDTTKGFDPAQPDQQLNFMGRVDGDWDHLTDDQRKMISMFEAQMPGKKHPLEALYGVSRSTFDYVLNNVTTDDLRIYWQRKGRWDTVATGVSENTTMLNQQVQLLQTDISSKDKTKARYLEMASSALTKMGETNRQILAF